MEVGTPLGKGKCFHFYYFKDLDFFQNFNFLFVCKLFVACLLLATSAPYSQTPPAPPPG